LPITPKHLTDIPIPSSLRHCHYKKQFMKNYQRKSPGGHRRGPSSHGGAHARNNSFGGPRELHKARCSKCNANCTVPFKPNGSKPVLCRECFRGNDGGFQKKSFGDRPAFGRSNGRSFGKPAFNKPSFDRRPAGPNLKKEMDEMNKKLDRILYLLNKNAPAESKETFVEDILDGPISFDA